MKRFVVLGFLASCAPAARAPTSPADSAHAFELRTKARHALVRNDAKSCVRLFDDAIKISPETAGEAYDHGACLARAGDADGAFKALGRAVDLGAHDGEHLQVDVDLATLHEDPRWQTLVTKIAAAQEAYVGSLNRELYRLYQADQADRTDDQKDWPGVARRDAERRKRVKEIVASNGARVSDDYFHAAMIFQHGDDVADYQTAHDLALKAAALVPTHPKARWLAAAAKDRELMKLGQPQKYGTQFRIENEQWVLYVVDPSVTDEERAKWNVPPLAQAEEHVRTMNGRPRSDSEAGAK